MVMYMETFLKRLSAYVAEYPLDFCAADTESILEAIYWVYGESHSIDNDAPSESGGSV